MCLIKNGEEKSLEMELAHIYLCLAFLCFAWRGGGLALALREGPPPTQTHAGGWNVPQTARTDVAREGRWRETFASV